MYESHVPCDKETYKDPQNLQCWPAEEARSAANQVVSHASAIALGWTCLSYEFQPITKEDAVFLGTLQATKGSTTDDVWANN